LEKEIKLRCKRCQREWSYKGNSPYYTTCPLCKTSINIRKSIVVEDIEDNDSEITSVGGGS